MRLDRKQIKQASDLERAKAYIASQEKALEKAKQQYHDIINDLPTGCMYPLTALKLSEPTLNKLYKAGYSYVYEMILITSPHGGRAPAPGIGEKTLKQIREALDTFEVTEKA